MDSLINLAILDEEAWRLVLEERQYEDDHTHHDVQTGRDEPLVCAVITKMKLASVVCKVSKQDAEVDSTSKETGTETTNGGGRNLGDVDGSVGGRNMLVNRHQWGGLCPSSCSPNNRRLSDTKAGDKSASIDGPQVSLASSDHEYHDANSPCETQYARGVDAANAVTNQEGTKAEE